MASSERSQRWFAIAALIGVNAVWGMSFPIVKSLNQQMEAFFEVPNHSVPTSLSVAFAAGLIALRFSMALGLLWLVYPSLIRNATKAEWLAGVIVGLFFYFGLVLQVMGLATIPASRSGFLTSLTAVFTPIFTAIMLRRAIAGNVILGVAIALLGVSVLTGLIHLGFDPQSSSWLPISIAPDALSKVTVGDILTTIGAMLFTGQVLLIDYYGKRLNTAAVTPGMFSSAALAAAITFLLLHQTAVSGFPLHANSAAMAWLKLFGHPVFLLLLLILAFFCSILAFVGMNKYQPYVTAVQASVIYSMEPVFASGFALFLPALLGALDTRLGAANEILSWPLVTGGALVLLANVVALWPRRATGVGDTV